MPQTAKVPKATLAGLARNRAQLHSVVLRGSSHRT